MLRIDDDHRTVVVLLRKDDSLLLLIRRLIFIEDEVDILVILHVDGRLNDLIGLWELVDRWGPVTFGHQSFNRFDNHWLLLPDVILLLEVSASYVLLDTLFFLFASDIDDELLCFAAPIPVMSRT